MKVKPLNNRVFVERIFEDERTKSGLFIPEQAKERPMRGTVIAVGEGKPLDDGTIRPARVKVGDTVLFGKYAGSEIKVLGKDCLILIEDDLFAIVEEEQQEIELDDAA